MIRTNKQHHKIILFKTRTHFFITQFITDRTKNNIMILISSNASEAETLPISSGTMIDPSRLRCSQNAKMEDESLAMMKSKEERPPKFLKGDKTKKLRFADNYGLDLKLIHSVPAMSEMSQTEKDQTWLSRREFELMNDAVRVDIMKASFSHHKSDVGEFPLRGLEWKTFEGIRQRNTNRQNSVKAVLNEQSRQGTEQPLNQEVMASAYRRTCAHCVQQALQVAAEDERIAKCIHQNGSSILSGDGR